MQAAQKGDELAFAELVGRELFEIGLLEDAESSRTAFRELQEHGFIRYEGLPLQSKTGERREVEFVSNLYNEDEETVIQCNIRDITQSKQAEEALRQSHAELERRVEEHTTELTKSNAELRAENQERLRVEEKRTQLLRRIVLAQEEERRRIAREMHDQFGQQLTGLNLKLDRLKTVYREPAELHEQIEGLAAIGRQLDKDVDFLVWELRPAALDNHGLQDTLGDYVQNWSKQFNIPVELHVSGFGDQRLTPEVETTLYRIAQEALNNIAKHAKAAIASVLLNRHPDYVSLVVEDDGEGFDVEQAFGANDKVLGLVGMTERAALVGGTLEIESKPGSGSTVIVRIPA